MYWPVTLISAVLIVQYDSDLTVLAPLYLQLNGTEVITSILGQLVSDMLSSHELRARRHLSRLHCLPVCCT
jgi:hypothetical protein